MLEDLFDELPKKGESEFHIMLCALQTLGITYSMHWAPGTTDKALHRKTLDEGGFNLSEGCLTGICIGNQMFVFSTGQAHWTTGKDPENLNEHKGHGPNGAFLYVIDIQQNKLIKYRTKYLRESLESDHKPTGVKALAEQYQFQV